MTVDAQTIQQLRERTGCGILDCKKALEAAHGVIDTAIEILRKNGEKIAAAKSERSVKNGVVASYIHPGASMGVLLKLLCETDFVARSSDFQILAHDLCLQIAGMNPATIDEFLKQPYLKDERRTVADIIRDVIAKVGENIQVAEFTRYRL